MTPLLTLLLATVLAHTHTGVPDSRQKEQANAFFSVLEAAPTACPALAEMDSNFYRVTTPRSASACRSAVDATAANLRPVSPWVSYTNQNDRQRSFLYRDGFMTVTYFPAGGDGPGGDLVVVQYATPHD